LQTYSTNRLSKPGVFQQPARTSGPNVRHTNSWSGGIRVSISFPHLFKASPAKTTKLEFPFWDPDSDSHGRHALVNGLLNVFLSAEAFSAAAHFWPVPPRRRNWSRTSYQQGPWAAARLRPSPSQQSLRLTSPERGASNHSSVSTATVGLWRPWPWACPLQSPMLSQSWYRD